MAAFTELHQRLLTCSECTLSALIAAAFTRLLPPPPHPALFTALKIDRMLAPKRAIKPVACGPVEELREAVDLIIIAAARKTLQLTLKRRKPGRFTWQEHVTFFHRRTVRCP